MENESSNTNAGQQDVRGEGRTREESHALSFINHWSYQCLLEKEKSPYAQNVTEVVLNRLRMVYGREAARAIFYLLHHVDHVVVNDFAHAYLYPQPGNMDTHVEVVIRKNRDILPIRGNTGRFLIFLRKENTFDEQLLHFTNRSSFVYYLLYLIHRHRHEGYLPPLDLRQYRDSFLRLYHLVYGGTEEDGLQRYQKLLRRHDGTRLRAGRESEVIYDIRRHLSEAFSRYDESFIPYAMSAETHLAISPSKILLQGLFTTILERK